MGNDELKKDDKNNDVSSRIDSKLPPLASRIRSLIEKIDSGLIGRNDIVRLAVLAALAGQNIFLYGPPGTAKSLLSRKLAGIFAKGRFFEHLMHRFCTPEELFGPISLSELKNDRYERKLSGYLADADFAFLDEIWKSSPAVLNTLLTVMNERRFYNGGSSITVPLKVLIAAANEVPNSEDGLDALYDRFLIRIPVNPVTGKDNFKALLSKDSDESLDAAQEFKEAITDPEYQEWLKKLRHLNLSSDVADILLDIRNEISTKANDDGNADSEKFSFVSDRRWTQISRILRAAAYFNGSNEVSWLEIPLTIPALWSSVDEIPTLKNTVYTKIEKYFKKKLDSGISGNFLKNAQSVNALLDHYEEPDNFLQHGIQVKMTADKNIWFRFLHDDGLSFKGIKRLWTEENPAKNIDLKDVWAPGILSQVKNPKSTPQKCFIPVPGSVIRIVLTRELNGFLGNIDLPGIECFYFTVPGLLRANGTPISDEKFTCQAGRLPKIMQLYLKECMEPEVELYARIKELPQHMGLDGQLSVTVRINFEGIFSEYYIRPDSAYRDSDKMVSIKAVPMDLSAHTQYGQFMHESGYKLYESQTENRDTVLISLPEKTPLPEKGEVLNYWNRFTGSEFAWCEIESYRRWFSHMVEELDLRNTREISCSIMPDGLGKTILVHNGLSCFSDESSRIQNRDLLATELAPEIQMRLQGIDEDRCLLLVSALTGPDLTSTWLCYSNLVSGKPSDSRDALFNVCGHVEGAKKPDGSYRVLLDTDEGYLETLMSKNTADVLATFEKDIKHLSELMDENGKFASGVKEELEKTIAKINCHIFLTSQDKTELTALVVNAYDPYVNECSHALDYKAKLKLIWDKYLNVKAPIPEHSKAPKKDVHSETSKDAEKLKDSQVKATDLSDLHPVLVSDKEDQKENKSAQLISFAEEQKEKSLKEEQKTQEKKLTDVSVHKDVNVKTSDKETPLKQNTQAEKETKTSLDAKELQNKEIEASIKAKADADVKKDAPISTKPKVEVPKATDQSVKVEEKALEKSAPTVEKKAEVATEKKTLEADLSHNAIQDGLNAEKVVDALENANAKAAELFELKRDIKVDTTNLSDVHKDVEDITSKHHERKNASWLRGDTDSSSEKKSSWSFGIKKFFKGSSKNDDNANSKNAELSSDPHYGYSVNDDSETQIHNETKNVNQDTNAVNKAVEKDSFSSNKETNTVNVGQDLKKADNLGDKNNETKVSPKINLEEDLILDRDALYSGKASNVEVSKEMGRKFSNLLNEGTVNKPQEEKVEKPSNIENKNRDEKPTLSQIQDSDNGNSTGLPKLGDKAPLSKEEAKPETPNVTSEDSQSIASNLGKPSISDFAAPEEAAKANKPLEKTPEKPAPEAKPDFMTGSLPPGLLAHLKNKNANEKKISPSESRNPLISESKADDTKKVVEENKPMASEETLEERMRRESLAQHKKEEPKHIDIRDLLKNHEANFGMNMKPKFSEHSEDNVVELSPKSDK